MSLSLARRGAVARRGVHPPPYPAALDSTSGNVGFSYDTGTREHTLTLRMLNGRVSGGSYQDWMVWAVHCTVSQTSQGDPEHGFRIQKSCDGNASDYIIDQHSGSQSVEGSFYRAGQESWYRMRWVDDTDYAVEYAADSGGAPGPWTTLGTYPTNDGGDPARTGVYVNAINGVKIDSISITTGPAAAAS